MLLSCVMAGAQTEEDFQQVFFRVGSASLKAESIPQSLVDSAQAVCSRGEKFTVLGVASPEGRYKSNVRLATRRARAIVRQLSKRAGLADSMFRIKTKVADMEMLRQLAAQDGDLPEKDSVMAILSAGRPSGATLARLKQVGGGIPYLYIKERLFPYLRASVASDRDLDTYRPNLAGMFQPQIVKHDYQADTHKAQKNVADNPSKPDEASHAVTEPDPSRHSSSQGDDESDDESPDEEAPVPEVMDQKPADTGTSLLPFWLVVFGVMIVMLLLAFFVKMRSTRRLEEALAEAQGELMDKDEQLKQKDEQLKQKDEQLAQANSELAALKNNLDKIKEEKTGLYNDGEALYNHLMIGGVTYEWTNEQIRTLIEYYKLQNYPLIHSLETEYDNLPLNHILFEILVNMGKSDQEIQRMMNISQTTIRSYRFRIKNKKI